MKHSRTPTDERKKGVLLAEAAAGLALACPILIFVVYAALEASYAFVIDRMLTQAASLAARQLSITYQTYPEIVGDTAAQDAIFSSIYIRGFVEDKSQFRQVNPVFDTSSSPPAVTVTCTYVPGVGDPALSPFPAPDPLNLGSSYRVQATATFMLRQ